MTASRKTSIKCVWAVDHLRPEDPLTLALYLHYALHSIAQYLLDYLITTKTLPYRSRNLASALVAWKLLISLKKIWLALK